MTSLPLFISSSLWRIGIMNLVFSSIAVVRRTEKNQKLNFQVLCAINTYLPHKNKRGRWDQILKLFPEFF